MKQIVGTKKQLEQDIVRNFATVETANVQITLPEKETILMKKSKRNSRNYGWCKAWSTING